MKQLPIINHQYEVKFVDTLTFKWNQKNDIVDLTDYQAKIMPRLPEVIKSLLLFPGNRQTIITLNSQDFHSCLISLQFQYYAGVFYLTGNYRSQCAVNGRPHDEEMLRFIATLLSKALKTQFVNITVNVGNYHINDAV